MGDWHSPLDTTPKTNKQTNLPGKTSHSSFTPKGPKPREHVHTPVVTSHVWLANVQSASEVHGSAMKISLINSMSIYSHGNMLETQKNDTCPKIC